MKLALPFLQQSYQTIGLYSPCRCRGKHWLLLVLFEVLLTNLFSLQAQQAQPIDRFAVEDQRLSEVIRQLSSKSNLNFTYDARDPLMETRVTYQATHKTALAILSDLLQDTQRTYKQLGNQIVIYQDDAIVDVVPVEVELSPSPQTEIILAETPVLNSIVKSDTAVKSLTLFDTLYVRDTIVRVDTLRLVDTIYVSSKTATTAIKQMPVLSVDYFADNPYRKPGWAMGLSITPMLSNFNTVTNNEEWSLRSFSVDGQLIRQQKRWSFALGLQFSHFAQKFNQSYEITTGGYYQTDTLDVYYTVVGTDTSWIAVTDTIYIPLESETFSYDKINRVGYLGLTVEVEYMFVHQPVFNLRVKTGLLVNSLLYREGIMLNEDQPSKGAAYGDLSFSKPVLGVLIGISSQVKLTKQFDLSLEASYRQYLNSFILRDNFDRNLSAIGISVGLIYHFK